MGQVRDAVQPKIKAMHQELAGGSLDWDQDDISKRFLDIWASAEVAGTPSFYKRKDMATNLLESHFSKETAAAYKQLDSALREMETNELGLMGADLFTVPG